MQILSDQTMYSLIYLINLKCVNLHILMQAEKKWLESFDIFKSYN